MLKTWLPGCFWAWSCTWTPWCAPRTTSCKGIQPWRTFALLKDLHDWNRCWWGLKEILRSLFMSAENAVNSVIRHLWPSVKGGGDTSPPPLSSPSSPHRAPALWSFNEGAYRWKSYLLPLKRSHRGTFHTCRGRTRQADMIGNCRDFIKHVQLSAEFAPPAISC